MAAKMEDVFPFTSAQWRELERQALIFKYLMDSIPVPPHLLLPISHFSSPSSSSCSSSAAAYHQALLRGGNKEVVEMGRCKRTDGKKWRCSREVAPNQKYCERHMHRGRPRSRKPVELSDNNHLNNKKTKTTAAIPQTTTTTTNNNNSNKSNNNKNKSVPPQIMLRAPIQVRTSPLFLETNTDLCISTYPNSGMGWVSNGVEQQQQQQWGHQCCHELVGSNKMATMAAEGSMYDDGGSNDGGGAASLYQQEYVVGGEEEPLSLFAYTDLGLAAAGVDVHHHHHHNHDQRGDNTHYDQCQFFLNPEMVPLDGNTKQIENPRGGFIHAFLNKTGNEPPCSLTLSMSMADHDNDDDSDCANHHHNNNNKGFQIKPEDSRWMSHSCLVPFARGGPLAEVLHTAASSYPTSPYTNHGDSISSTAANSSTVSSPSGVLHRALFSQSDTRVCNSPILYTSLHP